MFALLKEGWHPSSNLSELDLDLRMTQVSSSVQYHKVASNSFIKALLECQPFPSQGRQDIRLGSPNRKISSFCQQNLCDSLSFMAGLTDHLSGGQPGLPLQLRARGGPLHPPPPLRLLLHPLLLRLLPLHLSHHRLLSNTCVSQKGNIQWDDDASIALFVISNTWSIEVLNIKVSHWVTFYRSRLRSTPGTVKSRGLCPEWITKVWRRMPSQLSWSPCHIFCEYTSFQSINVKILSENFWAFDVRLTVTWPCPWSLTS